MTPFQYGLVWIPFVVVVTLGYLEIRQIRRIIEEIRDVKIRRIIEEIRDVTIYKG